MRVRIEIFLIREEEDTYDISPYPCSAPCSIYSCLPTFPNKQTPNSRKSPKILDKSNKVWLEIFSEKLL